MEIVGILDHLLPAQPPQQRHNQIMTNSQTKPDRTSQQTKKGDRSPLH